MARHERRQHLLLRRLTWIAGGVAIVLVVVTAWAVVRLNSNITRVDVSQAIGTDRPSDAGGEGSRGPVNILLMGSDTRSGLGTDAYGNDAEAGGNHSDTTLLVHLSNDRDWATVVSIPRDSMVPGPPGCDPKTPYDQWPIVMWNQNFPVGGAGCTIRAIEGNTGIFVDYYATVNFVGFSKMVDALGGIEVCTQEAIDDPASNLSIPAGRQTLNGDQALGYVRVRHNVGDGSDMSRIERQQAFMSSVVTKATSSEMLVRPDKLYGFLDAATQSLTTNIDFWTMRDIALSLRTIKTENITFVTVPVEDYVPDPNRVQWASAADSIWAEIRADRKLGTGVSDSPSPASTVDEGPLTVSPADISVTVLNASGVRGLATAAGAQLQALGFANVGLGDAAHAQGATVLYEPGNREAARTVAAAFPGATLTEQSGLGNVVQVVLGAYSPDVVEIPNRIGTDPLPTQSVHATPSATPSDSPSGSPSTSEPVNRSEINPRTADSDICS